MAEKTAIEWADATWNPWHGCHKVSIGCQNCYMFREKKRHGQDPNIVMRSKTTFDDPIKWKEPKMIFTCSWSDFFIEEANVWREDAWDIIYSTPQHTYQILTKRPERISECLPVGFPGGFRNVWLGVSVENKAMLSRLKELFKIQVTIRFISMEPLLGPIKLGVSQMIGLDWIIVGGESGFNARPMRHSWVIDIREQCIDHHIPFFFKQWGGNKKTDGAWGGRKLDGQIWNQIPCLTEK